MFKLILTRDNLDSVKQRLEAITDLNIRKDEIRVYVYCAVGADTDEVELWEYCSHCIVNYRTPYIIYCRLPFQYLLQIPPHKKFSYTQMVVKLLKDQL